MGMHAAMDARAHRLVWLPQAGNELGQVVCLLPRLLQQLRSQGWHDAAAHCRRAEGSAGQMLQFAASCDSFQALAERQSSTRSMVLMAR